MRKYLLAICIALGIFSLGTASAKADADVRQVVVIGGVEHVTKGIPVQEVEYVEKGQNVRLTWANVEKTAVIATVDGKIERPVVKASAKNVAKVKKAAVAKIMAEALAAPATGMIFLPSKPLNFFERLWEGLWWAFTNSSWYPPRFPVYITPVPAIAPNLSGSALPAPLKAIPPAKPKHRSYKNKAPPPKTKKPGCEQEIKVMQLIPAPKPTEVETTPKIPSKIPPVAKSHPAEGILAKGLPITPGPVRLDVERVFYTPRALPQSKTLPKPPDLPKPRALPELQALPMPRALPQPPKLPEPPTISSGKEFKSAYEVECGYYQYPQKSPHGAWADTGSQLSRINPHTGHTECAEKPVQEKLFFTKSKSGRYFIRPVFGPMGSCPEGMKEFIPTKVEKRGDLS